MIEQVQHDYAPWLGKCTRTYVLLRSGQISSHYTAVCVHARCKAK